ncbi:unnamed protein product [Blepharisma stoltei]|uniref:Uncharacterized protein n=1 Tax=Blepharisma stoltei TaxID=1481888 RepID=A0AAU9K1H8_9CILI|nr:unnamed protein product [Blepharisma stoltei]
MRHLYHGISRVDDGVKSPPLVKVKEEEHVLDFLFTKSPKNETKNFRITSPSPKLHKKMSLKPIPVEINDFLKYDKEKNLAFMSIEAKTRDISHLKDKIMFPPIDLKNTQNILPTDIKHLHKLLSNEEPFGCSNPSSPTFLVPTFPCMKEECNEFRLKTQGSRRILRNSSCTIPELHDHEKLDLGNPTGRQDVENLKKWLQLMIEKIIGPNKNIEDVSKSLQKEILLIYTICAKEIIRQVSVHCIERGEILKEVIEALMKIKFLKINRLKEKFRSFEEKWKKEIEGEIEEKRKVREELEGKIAELNENVARKSNSKLRLKAKLNSALKQTELLRKQTLDEMELNRRNTFYGFRSLTPVSNKSLGGNNNSRQRRSSFRASSMCNPPLEEEARGAMYDFENGNMSPISNQPDISDVQIQVSQEPSPEKKTAQNSLLLPSLPQEIKQNAEVSTQWDLNDLEQISTQGSESPNGEKSKVNFSNENQQKSIENLEIIEENEEAEIDINEEEEKFLQIGLTEQDLMKENSNIEELSEINIEERHLPDQNSSEKIIKLKKAEEDEEKNKSFSQMSQNEYKNPDESSPNNGGEDSLSKIIQKNQSKLNFITFLIKKKMIILKNLNKEIAEKKENMQYSSSTDQISMVLPNEENASELQSFFQQSRDNLTSSDLSSDLASGSEQGSDLSENSEDSELINDNDTLEEDKTDEILEIRLQNDVKHEMVPTSKSSRESETLKPLKTGDNKIVKYRKKRRKKTNVNYSKEKVRDKHYVPLDTNETETPKSGKAYDISPVHINDPIMIDDHREIELHSTDKKYTPIANTQINGLDIPMRRLSKRGNTMFLNQSPKPTEDEEKIVQKTNTERHIAEIQKSSTEMQLFRQDTKASRSSNPKQGFQRRKERRLTSTKFKTFHFQKKETIISKKIIHPAIGLLARFLNKKMDWIRKKSTMTRKMVHRLISSIYSSCLTKLMSGQIIEGLVESTYDEFTQRYGNKKSSEKKFIEFISSLFSTIDSKRAVNFMRFIGTAKRISMQNFSKFSFIFYLQAYHSIVTSNKGISVAYDDTVEKAMIPKIRAIEFLNTKLEHIIDKQSHSRISATIEYLSVPDPKKINISGLVETEAVLEIFIEAHEDYQKRINQGLYLLVEATRYNEDKAHLPFEEFLIYARTISPQKYYLARDDIRKWIENFKDDEETSQLEEIFGKCVEKNLLCIGDVHNFYTPKEDLTTEAVLNEMNAGKETMMDIIEKMKEIHEKKWMSLDEEEWTRKLENCQESVKNRNPAEAMLAWKIYKAELLRIYEIIDSS